jgi:hypothetical protein
MALRTVAASSLSASTRAGSSKMPHGTWQCERTAPSAESDAGRIAEARVETRRSIFYDARQGETESGVASAE